MSINFSAEVTLLGSTIEQLVNIADRMHQSTCELYRGGEEFLHNSIEAEACDEAEIIAKRLRLIADGIEGEFK